MPIDNRAYGDGSSVDRRKVLSTLGAGLTLGTAGCMGGGSEDGVELALSEWFGEDHLVSEHGTIPFMEQVEEESGGEITFDTYWDGSLGDPGEQTTLVREGTADIAVVGPAYESDAIPMSDVPALPAGFNSAIHGSRAYYRFSRNELYEAEHQDLGIRSLMAFTFPPYQAGSVGTQIETLEDWDGMNMRTGGGVASRAVEKLGGTAVEMSGPEIYQGFDRGTLDGVIIPSPSARDRQLDDFLEYFTTNIHVASFGTMWMMGDETWESLSDEHQDILVQAGEDASISCGEGQDNAVEETYTYFREETDIELYEVNDDAWSEWESLLVEVAESWASDVDHPQSEELLQTWYDILDEEAE